MSRAIVEFDVAEDYTSEREVLRALRPLADGWAYALTEGVPLCVVIALQSDAIFDVSPCLFRTKETRGQSELFARAYGEYSAIDDLLRAFDL